MRRATMLIVSIVALVAAVPAFAQVDAAKLGGMQARSIGPAGMSGRVAAVDLVIGNPDVIYVGAATGGRARIRPPPGHAADLGRAVDDGDRAP